MVRRAPSVEVCIWSGVTAPGRHSIRPSRPRQAAGGLLPACEQLSSCRVFGFFFFTQLETIETNIGKKKRNFVEAILTNTIIESLILK